jgi:transcriptional regulator with XRE-family HTH domain
MQTALNLVDLGRRIRAARLARRMTLEEVVSRTDFTVSWLSKLENGLLAPSLEGLVRLGEVLECGIEQLVAGLSVPARFVVTRRDEGRPDNGRGSRNGLAAERLAEAWRGRAMEPVILHVSGTGNRKAPAHHEGERFLHVLEGEVKLGYGDELIVLGTGDSVYLDAAIAHTIVPAGRGTARVLSVSFEPARNGHAPEGNGGRQKSRPAADRAAKR